MAAHGGTWLHMAAHAAVWNFSASQYARLAAARMQAWRMVLTAARRRQSALEAARAGTHAVCHGRRALVAGEPWRCCAFPHDCACSMWSCAERTASRRAHALKPVGLLLRILFDPSALTRSQMTRV
jgi:hypothetical protein